MATWLARLAFVLLPPAQRLADGVLGWLATYAIHSTVLIAVAALVARAQDRGWLRRLRATGIWGVALMGGVVTASLQSTGVLQPIAGTVRLTSESPAYGRMRLTVREVRTAGDVPIVASGRGRAAGPGAPVHTFTARVDGIGWPLYAALAWLASAAAGLALFLLSRARFLRMLDGRCDAAYTMAGLALDEVRRRAGVRRRIRLTISDRLASPVAIGRDEICLPQRALAELDPLQLETILAHELAHLTRRDPQRLVVARLVEALFLFQPLNRWARRRMQDDAEFASDAWAVGVVRRPVTLAHCLARVAEWTVGRAALPAPAMAEGRTSALVERVRRLTNQAPDTSRRDLRASMAAGLALLLLGAMAPRASLGASATRRVPAGRDVMVFVTRESPDTGRLGAVAHRATVVVDPVAPR